MQKTKLSEIIETYINGNITVAINEASSWRVDKIQIIYCSELFGLRTTLKILKTIGISDLIILNSFHDHDRDRFSEVKEILLNNFY